MSLVVFLVSFVLIEIYFRVAKRFNIIDKPNERSSHTRITIRGAGLVFPVVLMGLAGLWGLGVMGLRVLEGFWVSPGYNPADQLKNIDSGIYGFWLGLLIITIVSFWDDVRPLPPKGRMLVQAVAVAMMVVPLGAEWWIVALAMVLIIGTINAYNFMDGINGITALYSLVAVGTALVMLKLGYKLVLGEPTWLALGASLLAFSFYNVRKKARCFMGDVGAVSLAFVFAYWIYGLVLSEGNLVYILFLGVYGLDSVTTIILRIYRKENIFEAHRSHYYQYLANEKGWSHVGVSLLYAVVQLTLNGLILYNFYLGCAFFLILIISWIFLRYPKLKVLEI